MNIEEKIREAICQRCGSYNEDENAPCYFNKDRACLWLDDMTKAILAVFQPTEGELVPSPQVQSASIEQRRDYQLGFYEGKIAQLAHDKMTMVKLPSEEEIYGFLVTSMKWAELKLNQKGEIQTFYPLRGMAKEFCRLIKEGG